MLPHAQFAQTRTNIYHQYICPLRKKRKKCQIFNKICFFFKEYIIITQLRSLLSPEAIALKSIDKIPKFKRSQTRLESKKIEDEAVIERLDSKEEEDGKRNLEMEPRLNRREVILEDAVKVGILLPFEAGPLEDEVQEAIETFQSQQNWIQIHPIRREKATFKVLVFCLFYRYLPMRKERGGLKVVAVDRSSFKIFKQIRT